MAFTRTLVGDPPVEICIANLHASAGAGRRGEAELVTHVRQKLEPEAFKDAFTLCVLALTVVRHGRERRRMPDATRFFA